MPLGKLIPEFFQAQGCIPFALRPQKCNHLAKSNQAAAGRSQIFCLTKKRANAILKLASIRRTAHHELCQSSGGIQLNETSCLDRSGNVYFVNAQLFSQRLSMGPCGDDDGSIPALQGVTNVPSQGLNQFQVMLIEFDVVAAMRRRMDADFSDLAVRHCGHILPRVIRCGSCRGGKDYFQAFGYGRTRPAAISIGKKLYRETS